MRPIVSTPGTCNGAPRIRGTRTTVAEIVRYSKLGSSLGAIAWVCSLTREEVAEAIRYHQRQQRRAARQRRKADA